VFGRITEIESSLSDINTALQASVSEIREVLAGSLGGNQDNALKRVKTASRRTTNALEKLGELVEASGDS